MLSLSFLFVAVPWFQFLKFESVRAALQCEVLKREGVVIFEIRGGTGP